MAEQRPAFRFRLPWLPAAPPPRPTFPPASANQPTATTTPTQTTPQTAATPTPTPIPTTPQTAATPTPTPTTLQAAATPTPTPIQPTITTAPTPTTPQTATTPTPTPAQPPLATAPTPTTPQTTATQAPTQPTITPAPTQPSSTTASSPTPQTAEAITQPTITTSTSPTTVPQRAEIQSPTQPPAATATPAQTAERPPFRPPGVAPAQDPLSQTQTSRTESQPSSPSRVTTQPQVPSQQGSPSRTGTQSPASSQPTTPPRAAPQPRAVSRPSPQSRRSPQLPSPRTTTQPRSTSVLASRPAGQTSSPSSSTTAEAQPTTEVVNLPTSPSKSEQRLTRDSSQPSANSTEVISPLSDKQEPKSAVSETPSLVLQPKPAIISGINYDSQDRAPVETSIQPNKITQQPSKEPGMRAANMLSTTEGPEKTAVTQISSSPPINGKPESFPNEIKPEETKEVKEVMQVTNEKARDEVKHIEADLTGELKQTLGTKDLPSIAYQSEQTQRTIGRKEITAASAYNGKQTKITTAQSRNKTTVGDTHQKHASPHGEEIPLHKEIRGDISKLVNKMAAVGSKHSIDDKPVTVITLAGENRGASMNIGPESSRKKGAVHIHRGYKIKADDNAEATTDGEDSFKGKSNNPKTEEDQAAEACVNSNVQGINNSIVFNSSITERSPGVHLIRSHFPREPKKPSEISELLETRKAEFNMTPSQKLTHEPTVRRRCLRGLFLESSDSDLDNTKPRRHGCRAGCKEKGKENNIDVL